MTDTLVRMPKLADTLVEGTLGAWLKAPGAALSAGEPLATIETDKVTSELTAPVGGTLIEILVEAGQTVAVETPIARIAAATPGSDAAASPAPSSPAAASSAPSSTAPQASSPSGSSTSSSRAAPSASEPSSSIAGSSPPGPRAAPAPAETVLAAPTMPVESEQPAAASEASPPQARRPTPVAAKLLAEHHLKPDELHVHGRVKKADVLRHIEQGRAATRTPLTPMRRAIADHMTRAHTTIPRGQAVMAADLTQLMAWREHTKASFPPAAPLTLTVLFVHALAQALHDYQSQLAQAPHGHQPQPAGALHGHQSQFGQVHHGQRPQVDLGLAVALDGGLIVPVIRNADTLSLEQTAHAVADLATRARSGALKANELQGASMTLTNVGSFGNLLAAPIVPEHQLGILGPGIVERRPMATHDSAIRVGYRCLLSLMFDRRQLDDLAADRLLRRVVNALLSLAS